MNSYIAGRGATEESRRRTKEGRGTFDERERRMGEKYSGYREVYGNAW